DTDAALHGAAQGIKQIEVPVRDSAPGPEPEGLERHTYRGGGFAHQFDQRLVTRLGEREHIAVKRRRKVGRAGVAAAANRQDRSFYDRWRRWEAGGNAGVEAGGRRRAPCNDAAPGVLLERVGGGIEAYDPGNRESRPPSCELPHVVGIVLSMACRAAGQ